MLIGKAKFKLDQIPKWNPKTYDQNFILNKKPGLVSIDCSLGLLVCLLPQWNLDAYCLLLRGFSRIVNGKFKLFDIRTKKIVKTSLYHCLLCSGSGLGTHLNVLYQTSA